MDRNNLTIFKQLANATPLYGILLASVLLLEALGALGCAPSSSARALPRGQDQAGTKALLSSEPSKSFKPLTVNVVAILPLTAEFGVGLAPEDLERLTLKLVREFELRTSLDVRNNAASEELQRAIGAHSTAQLPLRSRAASVGRTLEAQGVIYAQITRYIESDGSKLGASRSGAGGFRLWLIDPQTEAVLWTATYDERDAPLSDNLLRVPGALRHGLRFHSVEEIFGNGFVAAAEALERLRKQKPTVGE